MTTATETMIEIEIPAALYQPFVRAVVTRFQEVQPTREWTDEKELTDVLLQGGMRRAWDNLAEVTAVLDQLAWTTIPHAVAITADSRRTRSSTSRSSPPTAPGPAPTSPATTSSPNSSPTSPTSCATHNRTATRTRRRPQTAPDARPARRAGTPDAEGRRCAADAPQHQG